MANTREPQKETTIKNTLENQAHSLSGRNDIKFRNRQTPIVRMATKHGHKKLGIPLREMPSNTNEQGVNLDDTHEYSCTQS